MALRGLKNIFIGKPPDMQLQEKDKLIDELYKKVGQKEIELEWMKKKLDYSVIEKIACIEKDHESLSI